jgi:hypothetical protein
VGISGWQLFERVDATKPVASRNESTEIFVVCRGYKAPKKVDPRLLDHRTLFLKDDEPTPNPDVFSNSKQKRCVHPAVLQFTTHAAAAGAVDCLELARKGTSASELRPKQPAHAVLNLFSVTQRSLLLWSRIVLRRNRTGYESGLSLIYKVKAASEFILAEKPTEMLSQFSKLSLVGEDAVVQHPTKEKEDGEESDDEADAEAELGPSVDLNEHPSTTQEIRALVEDLRVLGKKEFKLLMKWCVVHRAPLLRVHRSARVCREGAWSVAA